MARSPDALPNTLNVALVQMTCDESRQVNLEKAIHGIEEVSRRGAKIICLQELFALPYFCQDEDAANFSIAEPIPGPTVEALARVARAKQVVIIAPLFEKRAEGLYHNSAAVIDADGSVVGVYRKMHIPDDPLFYEKFYFTPGDLGFRSFTTHHGRIGVLICWDQWFPEAARLTALAGAQIIFYPTAIGWLHTESRESQEGALEAWVNIQRGHAIANGVFVAVANRVGREGDLTFWGNSFVVDPFGKMVAQAGEKKPETLIVECPLKAIDETRHAWPFLRDRRVDAYQNLTKRFID